MLKYLLIFYFLLLPMSAYAELKVVASFSILKDMVSAIGGDKISVVGIVGPDADAHTYSPTAQDSVKINKADLVFINAMGFEGSIEKLIGSQNKNVVVASDGITPLKSIQGEIDPHAWHDPRNGLIYYKNIFQALSRALPKERKFFEERYITQTRKITLLYESNKRFLKKNKIDSFVVLTSHDAFEYFGQAYEVKFIAPHSVSTESEPSAKDVANIISEIKQKRVQKIFLENMADPRNLEMITKDTGLKISGSLCADALSLKIDGCKTYYELLQSNFNKIFN
ncbi:MAG: zinc ABC transporter solute-binding protein [Bacteriovoracaceae bacterium]|nr:zinc ABC transporter solute-binding protein [Bacteriovoracaceae bacterium]